MIKYKWNESAFENRFVSNDPAYVALVHDTIVKGYQEGQPFHDIVSKVERVSGLPKEDVKPIVENELTILNVLDLKNMYEGLAVKKYAIDAHCICKTNKVYELSEFRQFETAPPLHFGCTATISIVE